ncbi:hemolysin III family protein [Pedococcus sp. NPDC057267]|uniref:PAQR family membrane homeostasis protein TrhA n=1 Tax=Pedococcus sp. NPDC057267 TaxID=3346077 RepID=UPI003638DA0E
MTPTPTHHSPESPQQGSIEAVVAAVKPRLRGWLHAGMVPLAVAAGIVLIALAPTTPARIAATVFSVTAWLLFGTSAVYHRGNWSPRVAAVLKRMDHSNIFLIIAGTYTPFAMLLPRAQATQMLLIVWIGAIAGVLFRVFWVGAPRWLYTPIYVALGWVAVFYMGPLLHFGGPAIVTLIAVGGVLYTVGALVYGIKRPNPSPRWFGFHEIFHTLTVAAFAVHYIAASMSLYRTNA